MTTRIRPPRRKLNNQNVNLEKWIGCFLMSASTVIRVCLKSIYIHRMQIWRTTWSPPGTSCMKARLVRPLCFVLTMLHQKSLASSSIWSVSFRPGCEFCVSECHQKGVKSSTEDKVFFLVCPFTSEGKTDGGKEFAIAQGTEKVYSLHFKLEDLSKYVTDCM